MLEVYWWKELVKKDLRQRKDKSHLFTQSSFEQRKISLLDKTWNFRHESRHSGICHSRLSRRCLQPICIFTLWKLSVWLCRYQRGRIWWTLNNLWKGIKWNVVFILFNKFKITDKRDTSWKCTWFHSCDKIKPFNRKFYCKRNEKVCCIRLWDITESLDK